ncbi:NADH-quinone oxidoreductase subunit C [Penaeicola halotolerans]|uniref:NADH-quinone oxidoreductase subunit C n=1 Tax=Penaeicola halotolerans TaxID=2793196 RepID=UPI001CF7F1AF|nr:NADH-quinone oxidoreductase subunit C [Penaeicola halotolerans]
MTFDSIVSFIQQELGTEIVLDQKVDHHPGTIYVSAENLVAVCDLLWRSEATYFDFLSCISGIDHGTDSNYFEVNYQLNSLPHGHQLAISVLLEKPSEGLPTIPTVSYIWKTALWHERETYDLMGINFLGHPDMRRILLPADWKGHPLRKDAINPEYYHGIKVAYDRSEEAAKSWEG